MTEVGTSLVTQSYLPGMEAEQRRRDLSQFFTSPVLAMRVWRWAVSPATRSLRILEPSAGNGALIRPLRLLGIPVQHLVAYEVDPLHCAALAQLVARDQLPAEIRHADFTADPDPGRFDLSVCNTPFEDGQEIAFAERALACCDRVVGIYRAALLWGAERNKFWTWVDPSRGAVLSKRPEFGGEHSPLADFMVLELRRRRTPRVEGEPCTVSLEWWKL